MRREVLWLSCLLIACIPPVDAGQWRSIPVDSRLRFSVTNEGQAVRGEFQRFEVRLWLDPVRPADGRLEVSVDLTSADMGSADVNEGIREPEWLNTARYQRAVFRSEEIRREDAERFVAHGSLRLKGREGALEVPFRWHENGDTAQMSGESTIRRTRFGIGTGEWAEGAVIGLDVVVSFQVQLRTVAAEESGPR